jgi:hypothetical protein
MRWIIIALLLVGCAGITAEEQIKQELIGHNLTYSNIAGQPVEFIIQDQDIISIESISEKEAVWKVHVGDTLSWELYLDENYKILRSEQLFQS